MLHLQIITPDAIVFDSEVESVTLPTGDGEITVLPKHIPLVTTVLPGSLIARQKSGEHLFAVSRGTIEIDGAGVRVLVRTADAADAFADEEAILKAKENAEKLMLEKRTDAEAFAEANAVLDRELARLKGFRRRSTLRRSPMPPTQQ
ncbi:MAG: F-type H+-transporting ATPase subunit epsilon [Candidatus Peregrinibacteria bacterium Greene1014_49]|nr:MAG: F-type H+-transporting ATPase subunit epsilon [Candidatus Peregrinibacteria bacterium Greene1014_49]